MQSAKRIEFGRASMMTALRCPQQRQTSVLRTRSPTQERPQLASSRINSVLASNAGNALEWYDFVIFAYLAPYLSANFFPADDPIAGLLQTYGVFAIGYLMRPLGGIIFGRIGDRLGRKKALLMSIAAMMIPTTLMALLPTHEDIGMWAPGLLIALRMAQGLSVGGEQAGAICYLVETAPDNRRGLFGSLAYTGTVFGILLGSAVVLLVKSGFTADAIDKWGWRIPFAGGLLLGLVSLWLRRNLYETPDFVAARARGALVSHPFFKVLRDAPIEAARMVGVIVGGTISFYTVFVWLPAYMPHFGNPSGLDPQIISTVSLIVLLAFIPVGGWLADAVGYKRLLAVASLGFAVLILPIFLVVQANAMIWTWVLLVLFAINLAMPNGAGPVALMDMMPTHLRYTGIALSMNLSVALFGGTAPLIATWLIETTRSPTAPAWYVIAASLFSFAVVLSLRSPRSQRGRTQNDAASTNDPKAGRTDI